MEIKPERVVVISYELKIASGDMVDQAPEDNPFAFIHGIGTTLEAFDKNLTGKKAGEKFEFKLTEKEGYGPYLPQNVIKIPAENFAEAPEGDIAVGKTVPMQGPDGNPLFGVIVSMDDKFVEMDFNLPLSGQELFFTGKVIEVREATKTELEHGHVHGEHGHKH